MCNSEATQLVLILRGSEWPGGPARASVVSGTELGGAERRRPCQRHMRTTSKNVQQGVVRPCALSILSEEKKVKKSEYNEIAIFRVAWAEMARCQA